MRNNKTVKNVIILCLSIVAFCTLVLSFFLYSPGKLQNSSSSIPRLYLYGNMLAMNTKKDIRSISAKIIIGDQEIECFATIKPQGTSSLNYNKKNFTINLFSDKKHQDRKLVDVGWGEQSEYCLKANWIDKTHSRNVVTAKLAAEAQGMYGIMQGTPNNGVVDGFPVEVYVNDWFKGIYTWNIPKAAWMFAMDEDNPNHIVMCGENWEPATLFYDIPNFESWSVEVGPENDETLAKFSRLSDFIMNSTDDEFRDHISQYIDLDSALNYYIFVDIAYLADNCGKNMLMATYDGQIWYPTLYDLDTSWGTDFSGLGLQNYHNSLVSLSNSNNLGRRLEIVFAQELHDRYFELRADILTRDHILAQFYEFNARIPNGTKLKEYIRWGWDKIPGYEIHQIGEYLDTVIPELDAKYTSLISY